MADTNLVQPIDVTGVNFFFFFMLGANARILRMRTESAGNRISVTRASGRDINAISPDTEIRRRHIEATSADDTSRVIRRIAPERIETDLSLRVISKTR